MKPANQADSSEQARVPERALSSEKGKAGKSHLNHGAPLFASPWLALVIILRQEIMNSRRKH